MAASPLAQIAPTLMRIFGEAATYTSAETEVTVTLAVILNRNSQRTLSQFERAAVTERRVTMELRRVELPASPRPGDTITLSDTGQRYIVKRIDVDDGNVGLLSLSVQQADAD